jgi:hypothetical protein
MKNTSTVKIAIGIFSGLMLWVCVFSYFSFAKYKPQIQDSEPKVKGAKTISVVNDLPTIPDSTELSSQKSPESGFINFKTELDQNAIQKFYYNVLTAKEWKAKEDTVVNKDRNLSFTKSNYEVNIRITKDESDKKQLVSVQYKKN